MPITFSQAERRALLNTLRLGRQYAIKGAILAQSLGYPVGGNQVKLRRLIKECIEHDGDLIGAVTGQPAGFFRIENIQELNKYIDSLESRTRGDNIRRSAILNNWNNLNPGEESDRQILDLQVLDPN